MILLIKGEKTIIAEDLSKATGFSVTDRVLYIHYPDIGPVNIVLPEELDEQEQVILADLIAMAKNENVIQFLDSIVKAAKARAKVIKQ